MIVAVVGASGGVGSATVKTALAAGLHVRAFARSREKLIPPFSGNWHRKHCIRFVEVMRIVRWFMDIRAHWSFNRGCS